VHRKRASGVPAPDDVVEPRVVSPRIPSPGRLCFVETSPWCLISREARRSFAFIRQASRYGVSLHISQASHARSVHDQELQVDGMGSGIRVVFAREFDLCRMTAKG